MGFIEGDTVQILKALMQIVIKMKFDGLKNNFTLRQCDEAGVRTHLESREEDDKKRASQKTDTTASGLDLERYGRKDRTGRVIYDPGVQIFANEDVRLEAFRLDLKAAGFKLVDVKVFQPFGRKANEYFLTCTFARDERQEVELTPEQQVVLKYFFGQIYGNVYVWRNYGGAQLDIPAMRIRRDRDVMPIDLRLRHEGRQMRLGSKTVEVAFEGDQSTEETTATA